MAAFLHGSAFPVAMYIFGDITNAFVNREATASLTDAFLTNSFTIGGQTILPCQQDLSFPAANITPDCNTTYFYNDSSTGMCLSFSLQELLSQTAGAEVTCLTNDLFIAEMNRLVYIFIGIAAGAFLFGMLQVWFFRLAAERQVFKIRVEYYRAVLRQEQGWFDLNATGTISNHLSK
jgi:ABC-type multidrug transport system fused ATPase/permease subunit